MVETVETRWSSSELCERVETRWSSSELRERVETRWSSSELRERVETRWSSSELRERVETRWSSSELRERVETRWSSSAERPLPDGVEHLVADGRDPAAVRQVLRNPFWQCSPDKIACADIFTAAYRPDDFPVTVARPSHTCDPTRLPLLFGWTDVHRMRTGPPGGTSHSVIVDNSKIKRFVPDFGARSPYSAGARQIMAWHNDHPEARVVNREYMALSDRFAAR